MATEYLLSAVPERRPLLHATIVANASRQYSVAFRPAEASSVVEQHYLRFALHYYARVLYELVRKERSVRDLPPVLDRIACNADTHGAAICSSMSSPAGTFNSMNSQQPPTPNAPQQT